MGTPWSGMGTSMSEMDILAVVAAEAEGFSDPVRGRRPESQKAAKVRRDREKSKGSAAVVMDPKLAKILPIMEKHRFMRIRASERLMRKYRELQDMDTLKMDVEDLATHNLFI